MCTYTCICIYTYICICTCYTCKMFQKCWCQESDPPILGFSSVANAVWIRWRFDREERPAERPLLFIRAIARNISQIRIVCVAPPQNSPQKERRTNQQTYGDTIMISICIWKYQSDFSEHRLVHFWWNIPKLMECDGDGCKQNVVQAADLVQTFPLVSEIGKLCKLRQPLHPCGAPAPK